MDTNELKRKLEIKGAGSSLKQSLAIDVGSLAHTAQFLRDEPNWQMDDLENISAFEMKGDILLTYFLKSSSTGKTMVLRATVTPKTETSEVDAVSVSHLWAIAIPLEQEISELFGVRFQGGKTRPHQVLPEGWRGFPLRKSYVFPIEFASIKHQRHEHE
ncbi:MAG: NADH-quinone oxidoreductase subunit C [Methylotenera sp.]|nr:NADH-quinone oxidoreductase subunit C [Oligoflexia bacterium]